jgi:LPS-assembly lipoprotein
MKRRTVLAFAASTALALSACGFQLRGSGAQTSLSFKTIYLGVPETSALGAELKRNLRANGDIRIVTDPKAAEALLDLLSETRDEAVSSLNTQGRIRELSLFYRLRFRVRDAQNKELLAPTEIVLKRDISYNESQAIAKEKEKELLYRDMQTDLVQQIMRRLAAIKPA